jgi:hypothetical protein
MQHKAEDHKLTEAMDEVNCNSYPSHIKQVTFQQGNKYQDSLYESNKQTPWSRVLLKKLRVRSASQKFPAFYGTRRFITMFTRARHLSISWAQWIQSTSPNPISRRSILMLPSHLRPGLPSGLLPSGFPTKMLYAPLSYPMRATCPAHLILLALITLTILGEE